MLIKLFIFLITFSGSHKSDSSLLDWSSMRRLTWDDFKARPNGASLNAALTSTKINIDYSYNNHLFKYRIRCQFDPSKSWGRVKNDYILSHEQGHFDIAEIYARLLNKKLKEYNFNLRSANRDIAHIYDSIMKEHQLMQEKYDEETDYSRNEKKQQEWKNKLSKMLEESTDYSNYK